MRIQVNVGKNLLNDIDEIATKIGVTRSSLCSLLISQGIIKLREDSTISSLKEDIDIIKDKLFNK